MKKIFLPIVAVLAMTLSCSTDDTSDAPETSVPDVGTPDDMSTDNGVGVLRITEVDATNDLVTITNLGDGALQVGDFFLCLGPGTYAGIGGLTDESTMLAPNASITLDYDMNEEVDGLSVFTNTDFETTDRNILLDYVQWGGANQARVDQAVTAGRWDNVDNFVPVAGEYEYTGGAQDVGVSFW